MAAGYFPEREDTGSLGLPCSPWVCHSICPSTEAEAHAANFLPLRFVSSEEFPSFYIRNWIGKKNLKVLLLSPSSLLWWFTLAVLCLIAPLCKCQNNRSDCSIFPPPFMNMLTCEVFFLAPWHCIFYLLIPQNCRPQSQFPASLHTHTHTYTPPSLPVHILTSRDSRRVTSAWCVESGPH